MSASIDIEREAFEAWAQKRLRLDVTRCAPPEQGFYAHEVTQGAWMAWHARAEREAPEQQPLTDDRIDAIADLIVKGMPEGIRGFTKEWGWRQFARALLDDCAGHYRAAEPTTAEPLRQESGADKAERVHALVNAGPCPGMSEAFDRHIGIAAWVDPEWRYEAALWAAGWKAAAATSLTSGSTELRPDLPHDDEPATTVPDSAVEKAWKRFECAIQPRCMSRGLLGATSGVGRECGMYIAETGRCGMPYGEKCRHQEGGAA